MSALARSRRSLGAAFLAALVCAPLHAANVPSPRDELLRFVPPEVGFCVVVQNLRENGKALAESPFAEQLRESAAGKKLVKDPGITQLFNMEEQLQKNFGIGWRELGDDILGDAVVFAYEPGAKGAGRDLMLIRARSADALKKLVDNFNKAPDVDEVREATYKGVKYHVRVDKRETNYYHLRGPILVFSSQEEMLKHAIDIDLAAASDGTPKLTTLLRELGADRALFAVVFNPRAFDAEVAGKIAKGGDPVLKTLFRYWKAVDAVVLSLTFDRDATLAIGVKGRSADLPASARRFFDSLSKPSDLWRQVPDDALLAVGGRIDFAALAESLGEFVPAEGRQKLETGLVLFFADSLGERNIVKYALPLIGHDCVMWLTAPADPKNLFPEGMFALRVGKGDKEAPVDEAILGQIRFFAKVAALSSSSQSPTKPLRVKSGLFDEQKVDYLEGGLLPAGIRPAFALKDGFLLLASAPEQIGRFMAPTKTTPEGPAPLLRVSIKAWRGYLEAHRDALADFLVAKDPRVKPDEAREHIDTVLSVLMFVDRLEVRHEAGAGYAVVSVVIQTAKPLRK